MGRTVRGVERLLRWISRFGTALFFAGLIAVGVAGLKAASIAGISPLSIPITPYQSYQLFVGGVGAALGGAVLNVLGTVLANVVATTQEDVTEENIDDSRAVVEQAPVSDRYRRKLGRSYFWIGGLVLLLVSLAARGDAIPGRAGRIASDIAQISVVILFGSVTAAFVFAAFFFGLWYGIRRRSAEALLVGLLVGLSLIASGVQYPAAGLILSGIWFLYYSFMARKAVRFRLLELSSVPVQVRRFVGQGDAAVTSGGTPDAAGASDDATSESGDGTHAPMASGEGADASGSHGEGTDASEDDTGVTPSDQ